MAKTINTTLKLLFFILLVCCSKNEKNDEQNNLVTFEDFEQKKSDTLEEPNYIAIFDAKTESKTTLSQNELKIVNKNLLNAVDKYNNELKTKLEKWNAESKSTKWNFEEEKINLRNYFRQYKVLTDENGDKIVRVFCFCAYFGNWKDEIISVNDGGDCYLNVTINLTKNKTEYFGTNGLA